MSTATRTPPSRLPSRPPAREERRRELRQGVLGALGLLVVLLGVPAALVLTVGSPLPTSAPSREWLTAQVSATAVLKVLTLGLWLAWAHFAVCVLTEWRVARRGTGVPPEIPLGGGSQQLARRLVAATLLLAGAATLFPGSAAPAGPTPSRAAVSISSAATFEAAPPATAVQDSAPTVSGPAKTYVVQPPAGRRYDSLWDIAERTLGDPYRYKEIFELNRARVQDDGRRLVDANLIRPGWVLQMPADASGPGVATSALAPPARQAPAAPAPASGLPSEQAASSVPVASPAAEATGLSTERMALGGGLLAAGLLVALSARRGPYVRPAPAEAEEQLRLAASPGRAALLDRALRGLAASCAEAGSPLPEIAVAYCDDRHVTLSLIGPAAPPPAPWTAVSDGRGWAVLAEDLPDEAPDVAAPYPALAGIAVSGDADVLVDLEAAPGIVALDGDLSVAREIAASLVIELATNLWSDGVQVTAVGFGDDLSAAAAHGGITVAAKLSTVLRSLEAESRAARSALTALGVTDVLSGRLLRDVERRRPRVVVLSGPPTPKETERLNALVGDGRTPLAVLCVGATAAARWRFTVDAAGTLDLGVLGLRAPARRLPREGYLPLLDLLREADVEREAAATVGSLSPRAALEEITGTGPAAPAPGRRAPSPAAALPTGAAAVEVRLLGPVEVLAPGPVDPAAQPLLTEIVVAAALHRDGLHEAVLRAEVWPRGVGDDVFAATVAQVQAWLGTAPDLAPRLRLDAEGRYVLFEDVHCDWDVLRASAATRAGARELSGLRRGLATVRGEAFSGTPADRFGSLVFHRAARDARVVGTAVARRAAGIATGKGDLPGAERALLSGLALAPTAEPLWRDLLRLYADDPALVARTADSAYAVLAARGLLPEAETDALVAQVAPGRAPRTA